eukprot:g3891.t1
MSRCATPPTTPPPLPFHCPSPLPTFRNLGPDQLAGVIFTCTEDSLDDCLRGGVFGLPRTHFQYVQHVRPSMVLFLFNFSTRELHGIFRAMTGGKLEGDPQGVNPDWAANFPAQVDVDTSDTYPPLPESAFRRIIAENYISSTSSQFSFELDMDQVARLSAAFKQFSMNRSTPIQQQQQQIPQFAVPNQPSVVSLIGAGASGGGGLDLKPSTPWPNEKTRRLSPIPRHPIRDLLIPGRPKSSMEHISSQYDIDLTPFISGGGGGVPRIDQTPPLQGSGLSLDPNLLQMSQFQGLLGVGPSPPPPMINQSDLNTIQALQKARLSQESPWGGGGLDPTEPLMTGLMGQLASGGESAAAAAAASSQLLNQTQFSLGLGGSGGGGGIRGRFSTGNLSPVDRVDPFITDPGGMSGLILPPEQNLDIQSKMLVNSEEKQQSKIWKVSPKDKGLVPDTQKVYGGAFKFPERLQNLGLESSGLQQQQQRFSGSLAVDGSETMTTSRYQETWGGPNPATWKPPRPHSSAEGELDPFSRGSGGLSTMYPDLKNQVQEISDEVEFHCRPKSVSRASVGKTGLKTKSRNNDEETGLSDDGGTPSESAAESPPKEQVNIKALEDETIAINRYENSGAGFQSSDLFLDKSTNEKSPVFGFSPQEYYSAAEDLLAKSNMSFVNALNGAAMAAGQGQNLMTMQSGNTTDFSELLSPSEPNLLMPTAPTGGLDLSMGMTGGSSGRMESEMMSRLVLENDRLRTERNQLQKQITSMKSKKPLDYTAINTSSSEVNIVSEMVLIGGLLDTSTVKIINPELPEQMKRIELNFNFCRGAGVNIGSHVFLMGGTSFDSPTKPLTELHRLDLTSPEDDNNNNNIKLLAPMKLGRCLFGSVSSGMKIFAIGGMTEQGPTDTVEIYDPILDSWMTGPSLNSAKHSLGTAVVNSIIYTVGGQSEKGAVQTVEMLDPREGKWIQIGSLSWSRAGLACCPVFNHLFAVGGHNGRSVLSSGEILDLRKGIVNESLTMIEPRQYGVALPIESSVYLVGGLQTLDSDNNSKFSRPEIFNTMLSSSNLVSNIPEEQLSMVFHSACAIPHCLY